MFEIGKARNKQSYPTLSAADEKIVNDFINLIFRNHREDFPTLKSDWFGHRCIKYPTDLFQYQELIVELRPEVIVECGTHMGGTAMFLASICQMVGSGKVVTIDIKALENPPRHSLLTYMTGSSVDPEVFSRVAEFVGNAKAMVILDSNHNYEHVIRELELYKRFVPVGGYLIVEDSHVNGHPTYPNHGPGPWEAVETFVTQDNSFQVDRRREKFLMTLNPRGYLQRVK